MPERRGAAALSARLGVGQQLVDPVQSQLARNLEGFKQSPHPVIGGVVLELPTEAKRQINESLYIANGYQVQGSGAFDGVVDELANRHIRDLACLFRSIAADADDLRFDKPLAQQLAERLHLVMSNLEAGQVDDPRSAGIQRNGTGRTESSSWFQAASSAACWLAGPSSAMMISGAAALSAIPAKK